MKKPTLAINGGQKVRTEPFPAQETIGFEEATAINDFLGMDFVLYHDLTTYSLGLKSNPPPLSGYRGNYTKYFYGGEQVQKFEQEFASKFDSTFAIVVNSCTSALIIACGAIGLKPGDEVIVTPWSMTCSATAPLFYGAVPVFADIEPEYFCLDPDDVERKITKRTKAIIVVDLFGQPYDIRINEIAKKHNIWVIEDAAQAIGSKCLENYAGTLGDIGCFSFTQGKHLTAGEGGVITTNNPELALKCQLIRNHSEAVVNDMEEKGDHFLYTYSNLAGYNMRMTELQAVILKEQLKKLDKFIEMRNRNVDGIYNGLLAMPFCIPAPRSHCEHSYYVQPFLWTSLKYKNYRNKFIQAVIAELTGEEGREDRPMLGCGYIKPIYLMPIFQHMSHWTFNTKTRSHNVYKEGDCPVVEKLWKETFFLSMYHNLPLTDDDIDDIVEAFYKVWENKEELK